MQISGSNSRPPEPIRRGTQRRRRGTRASTGPRIRCGFIFVNGCLCATNLAPYAGRGTNFLENISSRNMFLLRDLQFTRFGKILHVSVCAGAWRQLCRCNGQWVPDKGVKGCPRWTLLTWTYGLTICIVFSGRAFSLLHFYMLLQRPSRKGKTHGFCSRGTSRNKTHIGFVIAPMRWPSNPRQRQY